MHQRPARQREAVLRAWTRSGSKKKQLLAKTVLGLAKLAWSQSNPLLHRAIGYPDVPRNWRPPSASAVPDSLFEFEFVQFPPPKPRPAPFDGLDDGTGRHGAHMPPPRPPPSIVLTTDVVIVGSGCGGAVAAAILASAPYCQRVLVLDKGYHHPRTHLPMAQSAGMQALFENGGFIAVDNNSVTTVAGSTWGGGGTVNWSVSLRPSAHVRREWAETCGLRFLAPRDDGYGSDEGRAFDEALDRVSAGAGVGIADCFANDAGHNHANRVMRDGCAALGWESRISPQNTGGAAHYCGQCHLGCGSGEKRGPDIAWLPKAARAGAKFIEGFTVERVLFDDDDGEDGVEPGVAGRPAREAGGARGNTGDETGRMRRAVGVVGTWTSRDRRHGTTGPEEERVKRRVIVKAKRVIIAAGSLWSPVLLLNSGLTVCPPEPMSTEPPRQTDF